MFIRKKKLIILITMIIIFLVGCNGTIEKKIIGDWKLINGDEVENYLEIKEERMIIRTLTGDKPKSIEYILTETQGEHFILETMDSVNGTTEFLFEGYFENDNKLKSVENSGEVIELIRIDNIAEDMSKEKEKMKEVETLKAKKEKEKEKIKEERKLKEAKDKVNEEAKKEKEEAEYKSEYMSQEEWEECKNSGAYSEEECIEIDQYYAHGEGKKELEQTLEKEETYEWAEGVKETFEADIYEKGYVDSIETIRYEKYEPNGYPQGFYSVYGEVGGRENYIVVVNVKTGDYHG